MEVEGTYLLTSILKGQNEWDLQPNAEVSFGAPIFGLNPILLLESHSTLKRCRWSLGSDLPGVALSPSHLAPASSRPPPPVRRLLDSSPSVGSSRCCCRDGTLQGLLCMQDRPSGADCSHSPGDQFLLIISTTSLSLHMLY